MHLCSDLDDEILFNLSNLFKIKAEGCLHLLCQSSCELSFSEVQAMKAPEI